jgi:hypothetical protein
MHPELGCSTVQAVVVVDAKPGGPHMYREVLFHLCSPEFVCLTLWQVVSHEYFHTSGLTLGGPWRKGYDTYGRLLLR